MSFLRKTFTKILGTSDVEITSTGTALDVDVNNDVNVYLHDGLGNPIGSLNGALDTHDADVHNIVLNKEMHQHTATTTTLSVATAGTGSEYVITVASAAGFSVNDRIHIGDGTYEVTHPKILSITGNDLTLDRKIDFAHAIGTPVLLVVLNMATQIGTLATPQEYFIAPVAGEVWHLTRFLFSMVHSTAGDLGKFAGITALTNGVLLRVKVSGQYGTFTNWKACSDMKDDMFDVEFDSRSGGGGSFGTSGRGTITNAGAVVRLDGDNGDRIEIYIQDDLTGLNSFHMKFQGHSESN